MKNLIKGFGLGISLIIANKLCCAVCGGFSAGLLWVVSIVVFAVITVAFLVSDNIGSLLVCGFTGLFVMIAGEIVVQQNMSDSDTFDIFLILLSYLGGFFGSMGALSVAVVMTVKKIRFTEIVLSKEKDEDVRTDKTLKMKLLAYAVISAAGFSYLVMPQNSGIGVLVFAVLQFVCLLFVIPERKKIVFFVPILIMATNSFISANSIWRVPNFLVSIVMYSCMFVKFDFRNDGWQFLSGLASNIFKPIARFTLPFRWIVKLSGEKASVIKRVATALVIAVPCAVVLVTVLSNADMVFSVQTRAFVSEIFGLLSLNTVYIGICGIFAGLYLFGLIYNAHTNTPREESERVEKTGDVLIINILLAVVLIIYTMFTVVQFKYLFAGSTLPEGLSYTEYARKGFFELLALTCVNIAAILTATKLTKKCSGAGKVFTDVLCHYLCAVTVVLLASSFYRMLLYTGDDGLTRLRFFVLGFLVFEAVGLLATFVYIAGPKFNVTVIYAALALVYYIVLNVVPVDNIIAENQISKYIKGEREDIDYVYTLSADAAPALAEYYKMTDNEKDKADIKAFMTEKTNSKIPSRWQRYNLSVERAEDLCKDFVGR